MKDHRNLLYSTMWPRGGRSGRFGGATPASSLAYGRGFVGELQPLSCCRRLKGDAHRTRVQWGRARADDGVARGRSPGR